MIPYLLAFLLCIPIPSGQACQQDISPAAAKILNDFVQMHASPTDEEIAKFINMHYDRRLLASMSSLENHIEFYRTIIDEFGQLSEHYLQVDIAEKGHYRVQLFKKGLPMVPRPSDFDILVVDIEVDEKTNKLKNGLGLGALVCYDKR